MTDAVMIQAVLLPVLAVPHLPAVHQTRAVQFRLEPAVLLRLAVLLTRAVLLLPVTAVATSAAKAVRLKMRVRSQS